MKDRKKRKRKRRAKMPMLPVLTAVLFGVAALLLTARVCALLMQNHESSREYENIAQQYWDNGSVISGPEEEISVYDVLEEKRDEPETKKKPAEHIVFPYHVDFEALKKENPDTAAWITLPGTEINYPVLFNGDNTFYLTHTFEKKVSHTGAIFIDGACIPDLSTTCTIIYGHNISGKTGTMFGTLTEYKKQEFLDANPYLWLASPDGNYRLDVFACMPVKAVSEPYDIDFISDTDIRSWLDHLHENSMVKADVDTDVCDRYVILSTCSYEFYNARTVVAAKLVPCDA